MTGWCWQHSGVPGLLRELVAEKLERGKGWRRWRRRREGGKEDYEGPATRGLLLGPEKVCRKRSTHSGNKPQTLASLINNRKLWDTGLRNNAHSSLAIVEITLMFTYPSVHRNIYEDVQSSKCVERKKYTYHGSNAVFEWTACLA